MVDYLKANPLLVGALITAITGVVLAILKFLFDRWNFSHSTNLEIEKKKFDRRMEQRDSRVKEAREFVAKESLINDNMYDILSRLIKITQMRTTVDIQSELDEIKSKITEMKKFSKESNEKVIAVLYLDDKKLVNLIFKFMEEGDKLFSESEKLTDAILVGHAVDVDITNKRIEKWKREIDVLTTSILLRIDELAVM